MRIQDAIDTFGNALGLAPTEASIYVHLCVSGPAKAGDLATLLDLHRNEVYRTANRLVSRGLVQMTLERPARYAAVDPNSVFENEIRSRLATVEDLKHLREQVSPLLAKIEPPEIRAREKSTYKVVQGREDIYAIRRQMIENATETIQWATTFPPELRLASANGAIDLIARRMQEGIQTRAIVRGGEEDLAHLAPFRALDVACLRTFAPSAHVRFFIVDGEELLMWVVNDPSGSMHAKDEVAIHTTAPGFVQAQALFFEETWDRAAQL